MPKLPVYQTITITVKDGATHTAAHPSLLVKWLCDRDRWTSSSTLSEHKADYAERAKIWSGQLVDTATAWKFLRDMESAGILSISFDSGEIR